ncbi:hypothetical protein N7467_000386 [Penicillium canescens]|nr:hypothetical protein N7467_000386 [Penicillium canescens]
MRSSQVPFPPKQCSGGIGVETAQALASTGAKLFLTARDLKKAKEALSDILLPGHVELLYLDLTSLASVRSCADEFLEKSQGRLNILICNTEVLAAMYPIILRANH